MDKTLTQEEVDALLQAMKTGEVKPEDELPTTVAEEVKVVAYNFRKPRLVSGDQLHGFQVIHDLFAKGLQTGLFVSLKKSVDIKLVAIDQFTYGEFILSLFRPTYLAVMSTTPSIGEIVVEMNLSIVLAMIDILLGGDGTSVQEPRELTAIEQTISTDITDVVRAELKSAWSNVIDLSFTAQSFESNPEYVQLVTSESLVLSVTLDLRMGELSGVMNICYPFQMVQPLLGKLSARIGARRDGLAKVDRSHEEMLGAIGKVPLDLHAVIGRSVITTDQLANLKVGDLIRLDRRIDQPIEVQVADRPFFSAEIGRRRNKAAIRLLTSQFNLQGGNGAEGAKK